MPDQPLPIVTQEITIVDAQGKPRILLSAGSGVPVIALLLDDGKVGAEMTLDPAGRPSVTMSNPDASGPSAALAIDDKGAHVRFDRPGGASSYLFLGNLGTSGVVLTDAMGVRRVNVTTEKDGAARIERLDDRGVALP